MTGYDRGSDGFVATADDMNGGRPRLLLIEDGTSTVPTHTSCLQKAGFDVRSVATGRDALEALVHESVSLIVLDPKLPDMDGIEILEQLRDRWPTTGAVLIASNASLNAAIRAVRAGAHDYLVRPFSAERLVAAARAALPAVEPVPRRLPAATLGSRPSGFIGSSAAMAEVYRTVWTAAASKASIFLTGESGTGKEVCAEAIHRASARAGRPFVAINCAAIPKDLAESELFGHVKGAFTGAVSSRVGAAVQAHRGTLFLDEVCEMDINLQTKLLRFLQTGTVRRVGAAEAERVDVRIICATNRDPLAAIAAGRFREDLYYRLHVIPIHLPPVRERGEDVLEIAQALLADYAREEGKRFVRLAPAAAAAVLAYPWPGNVRELQNVLRSAVVLNDGEELALSALPERVRQRAAEPAAPAPLPPAIAEQPTAPARLRDAIEPLWKVEREHIEDAVRRCDNNVAHAAEALGISPSTIYRKRQAWATGNDPL
jgi:DNA-binding NtrC family response regulator